MTYQPRSLMMAPMSKRRHLTEGERAIKRLRSMQRQIRMVQEKLQKSAADGRKAKRLQSELRPTSDPCDPKPPR